MKLYNDYYFAKCGTKENIFYNFFSSYFTEDDFDDEESVAEFVSENSEKVSILLEGIEEFITTNKYSDSEKSEFISEITCYACSKEQALKWLKCIVKYLEQYIS